MTVRSTTGGVGDIRQEPESPLTGGRILALYEGRAGDAAIREAVLEARRRNARIDVIGVDTACRLTSLLSCIAVSHGYLSRETLDRSLETDPDLKVALASIPADIPVEYRILPKRCLRHVDVDTYVRVIGRYPLSKRRPWVRFLEKVTAAAA